MSSKDALEMTEAEVERELEQRSRELLRQLMQGHLELRGPGQAAGPVKGADGRERNRKRTHGHALETVFGQVCVERLGYRAAGVASLHPLDGELNLPEDVIQETFRDARSRDLERRKQWVALVDGNDPQLKSLAKCFRKEGYRPVIILDFIHVAEKVWQAGLDFFSEGTAELEQWVTPRLLAILQGRCSQVAAGMRRSSTKRGLATPGRKRIDACARYMLNHKAYMRYDVYLQRGYPIATGVIEGACRYLVKDRKDITGARWSLKGAEAVLQLRALRTSGDFGEYWRFHEQQHHTRTHSARYANGKPVPVEGRRPRLKLVNK